MFAENMAGFHQGPKPVTTTCYFRVSLPNQEVIYHLIISDSLRLKPEGKTGLRNILLYVFIVMEIALEIPPALTVEH